MILGFYGHTESTVYSYPRLIDTSIMSQAAPHCGFGLVRLADLCNVPEDSTREPLMQCVTGSAIEVGLDAQH